VKELLVMGRVIYNKTPSLFLFIFLPASFILVLARFLRQDLWIITGEEITNKQKLTMIYSGSSKVNKSFLIKLAFDSSYREDFIGKTWVWKTYKMAKERSYNCALMFIEVPRAFRIFFRRKRCFYIPLWVIGEIDISVDISSFIRKKSVKADLRRIKKNDLHFELTNDRPQFQKFYYNMYLPYTTKVYGTSASIMQYDHMMKEFRNNTLLLVKKEKEYIAGMLFSYRKNVVHFRHIGVKDGNVDYVKNDGAIGALYYFAICYLQEKGYDRVNLGGTRAFLKDGVLRYKKKWNIKITKTNEKGFLMKPLLKTEGVKGFLLNNPFIYMDKKRLNGAIFVETDQSLSKEDFRKIYKDYYLAGISNLFIYRFGEGDSKMQEIVPFEFSDRITVYSG